MRPLPVTTGARAACFAHGPPLGSSAAPPAQGSTRRPLLPATSASAASAAASTAVAAAAVAAAAAALPLGSSPAPSHSQQHVPQARSPRMHPVVASHCVFNRRQVVTTGKRQSAASPTSPKGIGLGRHFHASPTHATPMPGSACSANYAWSRRWGSGQLGAGCRWRLTARFMLARSYPPFTLPPLHCCRLHLPHKNITFGTTLHRCC